MPTLPTLTVTDAQATRILDAFKARFGTTTTAETVAAYKKWLATQVRGTVLAYEAEKMDKAYNDSKRAQLAAMEAEFPDPNTAT